jgi:DNA-binding NtrC family response regulator
MKKHILCVDDETDIREMLKEILTIQGYRVSAVATPDEARQIVKNDLPQLVISDFQIEDQDGFVMVESLKKISPNLPILLLTGVVFDHDVVREMIPKKVSAYLDKTASLATIVTQIRRLLGEDEKHSLD